MHTTNAMNIINLVVRIIEGSDKCSSDNRGCTVLQSELKVSGSYFMTSNKLCMLTCLVHTVNPLMN